MPTRLTRRWSKGARLAASVLAAASLVGLGAPSVNAAQSVPQAQVNEPPTAECPRLIVPAYFNPGPEWDRLIAAAPLVEYVILNPNSGPGEAFDEAWLRETQRAQAAGIKVLGYVFTDIAREDPDEMKAQIRAYQEWYGVDGIHLDGVHNEVQFLPYYADLAEVVRDGGRPATAENELGIVMLNPGYVPAEEYMEIADIVETYEWYYDRYPAQEFPAWIDEYPADRFNHVIRNTPASTQALDVALSLMRDRNVGYIYVTNLTEPREYASLPSFWDTLVASACPQG